MVAEEKKEVVAFGYGMELTEGNKAAGLLKASMDRKKKKIFFNGKEYAEFHDLQVVCNYFGHSVRTYEAQPVEIGGIQGFKAHADLINKDGIHIGGAEAYCMKDEPNWARKPLFQLASMAQTRAAAKCITNDYRWVLDLAGYGTTPAEEMPTESSGDKPQPIPANEKPTMSLTIPQTADILVESIKDFVSKKGTVFYRIYDASNNQYMIFDRPLIEMAKDMVGREVTITFEESKFGKTVKDMAPR